MPFYVGNITTGGASIDVNGMDYSKYWDQITPENAGKWGSVQSSATSGRNWNQLDQIYAYTEDHNILYKHHCFVWGSQQPSNSGSIQEADVKSWMKEFCTKYPNTRMIDVVNEPPPHTTPAYANNIGGGTNGSWQWIINAFKWADEACPNAVLILNDYNNIEWTNDNQHFIDIVKTMQAAGAPIDAIGAQAHDLDHASVTTDTMKKLITKLHEDTGLPVYVTEYDISTTNDQQQLTKYQEQVSFFMDNKDWIRGLTIWGWIVGRTWSMAPDSGLVNNTSPRPAMTWLMEQVGKTFP
ncbi:MAG: endo-1,4-beta-xylanase [Deltaproteobacteria bacterium]|nr:endo-1,4-beta-xylanase [Deltaproteobacteria bacterium]